MGRVRSADGVPIAYWLVGEGRPALVFVHGWCCDRGYWEAQVPYFAQRHTVVTLPRVGHFVMMEDPESFNHLLAKVVKELASLGPGLAPTSPEVGQ